MRYNFYVKDASEVDFARILRETPPEENVVLVTTSGPTALLAIRRSWLKTYDRQDHLRVSEEELHSFWWATPSPRAANEDGGITLYSNGVMIDTNDFRATIIRKTDIASVVKELETARAFNPRREVRVSYL